jgi:hypothetical protein
MTIRVSKADALVGSFAVAGMRTGRTLIVKRFRSDMLLDLSFRQSASTALTT